MTYPTDLEAVEEKLAWLLHQSACLQAAISSPSGVVTAKEVLDQDEITELAEHQQHYRKVVQEFATHILGTLPELVTGLAAGTGVTAQDELTRALQILPGEHEAAATAAGELLDAVQRGEVEEIDSALQRCLTIQDKLAEWHRRLFASIDTLILRVEGGGANLGKGGPDSELAKTYFSEVDNALREAFSSLPTDAAPKDLEVNRAAVIETCRAVAAVLELRQWVQSPCDTNHHPMVSHLRVAVRPDSLQTACQNALDGALTGFHCARAGCWDRARAHLDEAIRQVSVAECYFVLRAAGKSSLAPGESSKPDQEEAL